MRKRTLVRNLIRLSPAALALGPWLLAICLWAQPVHKVLSRSLPTSFFSSLPIFSDFDGDNKIDQAELSSHGRFKKIDVTLGDASSRSFSFDSGVSDRGRLVSGDIDSDGDADLLWISQGHPGKLVMWFGDGRGNFSIATDLESHLHRIQALLASDSESALTDDSDGFDPVYVVSVPSLMGLRTVAYHPHVVCSKRALQANLPPPLHVAGFSIFTKRGPPSNLLS